MSTRVYQRELEDWRLLRIYAGYRLLLSVLLILLFYFHNLMPMLGAYNRSLYLTTALAYFATAVSVCLFLLHPRKRRGINIFALLLVDILALTLMTHASGAVDTQLPLLHLVVIAAGNILLTGRLGALLALAAALCVFFEQFHFSRSPDFDIPPLALAQSALLCASFFATALFSQIIARRMRQGEKLAELRAKDIVNLQLLNEQIIRRMHTGIIALNPEGAILLSNDAAQKLLGLSKPIGPFSHLKEISARLDAAFSTWRQNPLMRFVPLRNSSQSPEIRASFAPLATGGQPDSATLLFLEDTAQMAQQAQQLKMASLGRLTTSIAHEVRNPLGAISHATQLLAESENIDGPDRRLLEIITQHCKRMNAVVEDVLSLSRRQLSSPQFFTLDDWLLEFREEYLGLDKPGSVINIRVTPPPIHIRFDPQQLYQVVSNLATNGLRYSRKNTGRSRLLLEAGRLEQDNLPFLDIIDFGSGIAPEQREHLFEPFFTTESAGTGLGLYLSREICAANQAQLDYRPRSSGACFRITFSHPDRLS